MIGYLPHHPIFYEEKLAIDGLHPILTIQIGSIWKDIEAPQSFTAIGHGYLFIDLKAIHHHVLAEIVVRQNLHLGNTQSREETEVVLVNRFAGLFGLRIDNPRAIHAASRDAKNNPLKLTYQARHIQIVKKGILGRYMPAT